MKEILTQLCETDGVTGFEGNASALACELLKPYCDSVEIDSFGSVIGKIACPNPEAKTIALDAHIDQIGFVVTDVLDNGFVRFASVGGVDPRMLLGAEVMILEQKPVYGVIACMPPHLMKAGEQDKAVPIHKMVIDTGYQNARDHVSIGTPIVFAEDMCSLSKDSITG
ncbi:MAG: M42 family peptidase, partial [Butyricicoccaceae bacterium]